jgi:hypothetical protein
MDLVLYNFTAEARIMVCSSVTVDGPVLMVCSSVTIYHVKKFKTLIQKIKFLIEIYRTENHTATVCGAHSVNL